MAEEVKSADAPVQQPAKGPFVHSLRVYLVGGQQFTLNEVTDSPEVPRNVVAFINAWRAKEGRLAQPQQRRAFRRPREGCVHVRIPRRPTGCSEG